jgi:hypothetical protein
MAVTGFRVQLDRTLRDPSLRREADMMGLYLAIALIAALSAGKDRAPHTELDVLWIVWGTTVGLALAHWFAVILSARLVRDPAPHHTPLELLYSQMVMASCLAAVATLVVLVVPSDFDRVGARLTAAVSVAVIVLVESRAGGSSASRGIRDGLIALVIAVVIAMAKLFIA